MYNMENPAHQTGFEPRSLFIRQWFWSRRNSKRPTLLADQLPSGVRTRWHRGANVAPFFGTTPTSTLDPFAQPTPVVEQLFAEVLRIR